VGRGTNHEEPKKSFTLREREKELADSGLKKVRVRVNIRIGGQLGLG
jgi:hypothetical protein